MSYFRKKLVSWLSNFTCAKALSWKRNLLSFVVGLVGPFLISLLFDIQTTFVGVFIILILFLAFFLSLTSVFFYKILVMHDAFIDENQMTDLYVIKRSKIVEISLENIKNKACVVTDRFSVMNQTGQDYEDYVLKVSSSTGSFLDTSEYVVMINGEEMPHEQRYVTFSHSKVVDSNTGSVISNVLDTRIKLNLPPSKVCDFSLKRPAKTMSKLFNFESNRVDETCLESVSVTVAHKTKKLKLACYLDKDVVNAGYTINPHCNSSGEFMFEIMDGGKQNMKNYKTMLSDMHIIPRRKQNGLVWTIPNPRVGYTYTLSFCLSKDKSVLLK